MLTDILWPTLPEHVRRRIGFVSTQRKRPPTLSVYDLNFGLHVGDDPVQVLERRRQLAHMHDMQPVWMKQVHGTECAMISQVPASHNDTLTADAAWTKEPGLAVVVMTADCLPVLLVDAEGRAVAAVHCGWRGLLDGVLQNTIDRFEQAGFLQTGLHAWLGPCIGPKSFEVGSEVRDAFVAKEPALADHFKLSQPGICDKWLADLHSIAAHILSVRSHTILSQDKRDTYADPLLHSFRRDRVTGRQASLIWLRPEL